MSTEKPKKTNKVGSRPGYAAVIGISLLTAVVTATVTVAVYDTRYAQKVVAMDLKGYVKTQRDRLLAGEIDDEGLRASFDAMEQALLNVPPNHTVILKEVVLRNAPEVTVDTVKQ
ncbi:hypothetical protein GF1_16450 [Desulfolithobacter dissulfuricans]|uniref:Uncharacterized protein n=1 Tax=Desulfolithobacter dissulfuricans TaxID=2795293 RepID=A0A915U0L1_9BACT|nr:hypothetical protein [Desulfolithobacter dissulfuricans]BCO09269.1 hypothetical protein GF1_16450 [Desulfolithobacter dissulfuricans]